MTRHHLICRCCAGRMTVASATNPNVCAGCEQLLVDDSPADAVAQMGTVAVDKEELMDRCPNLKVVSLTV